MNKIYLVVSYLKGKPFDVSAFTDKKKAEICSRYRTERAKNDKWYTGQTTKIIERQIIDCDYTDLLNKLLNKELP